MRTESASQSQNISRLISIPKQPATLMPRPAAITAALFAACLLAAYCAAAIPRDGVARESCDVIEVNAFYGDDGKLIFDQAIFWDWSDRDARYMVRAWRLIRHPSQLPQRDWEHGGYVTSWHDGELLRHVRAKSIRETWLQYDPELVERNWLPRERRAELVSLSVKRPQPSQASFDDFHKHWTAPQ